MARPKKDNVKAACPQTSAAQPAIPGAAAEVRKTPPPLPSREEVYKMIQTASFFRAEKDGFRKNPATYWEEAEKEIMARYR